MPAWLKILLGLLLFVVIFVYIKLKAVGIIPKHDYETVPPEIPAFSRPAVLVFNKTNGFRHIDALPVADEMFRELAANNGWDVFVTDNAAVHNADVIKQFKLVIWNNVSGDVLTQPQRQAFKQWLTDGGGWLGIHAAGGDMSYQWQWYVQSLVGAQFIGHTMDPQFQDADVIVTDPGNALTDHLPPRWRIPGEEWYAFDASPRSKGFEILLTIDKDSYVTTGKPPIWDKNWTDKMQGEHTLAWRHRIGEGRAFYSAIGHQPATYRLPQYREFLSRAMRWAMSGQDVVQR